MTISELTLYNILRKKLGEQETAELVEFVRSEVKSELDIRTNIFMTKQDKIDLTNTFKDDKIDLIDRINKSKTETIAWVVGVGLLQFILVILTKKIL